MGFAKVTDLALFNWRRIQPIAGRWETSTPPKELFYLRSLAS
jgi:hypothetical protein